LAAGTDATIVTDESCHRALLAGARAANFPAERVQSYPDGSQEWIDRFFTEGAGRELTHLIAIERVGPGHTPQSLASQPRDAAAPVDEFLALVPAESQGRCHNMRGRMIDEHTADTHRIFEELLKYRPDAKTIGVGDGANEIGMGTVPWEELYRRLPGENAARIPCRIATDWNIIAGTSNWGGYALAAAVLLVRGRVDLLREWNGAQQRRVLEQMVEEGPTVDGVTGRRETTVDGLPFLTYIQPWEGIRRLLGFPD
jgi:hypothetical protein